MSSSRIKTLQTRREPPRRAPGLGLATLLLLSILVVSTLAACTYYGKLPAPKNCTSDDDCAEGYACDNGRCHLCGDASGRPCCAGECEDGFRCVDNTCYACGGHGEYCCDGNICDEPFTCDENMICRGCGRIDEPCCNGACDEGACINGTCKPCFVFSEDDTKELYSGCARG